MVKLWKGCGHCGKTHHVELWMVDTRWTVIGSCAARLFVQSAALEQIYGKLSLTKKDLAARDESRLYRLVKRFTGHVTPVLKHETEHGCWSMLRVHLMGSYKSLKNPNP